MIEEVDKLIIGAGIYGLYTALYLIRKNPKLRVLIIESECKALTRASYANQARVHMGYHYPRSYSTAKKTADYFRRFSEEFDFCINRSFNQVYAISSNFSWTNSMQFEKFCKTADIPIEKIDPSNYFSKEMVEGAYLVKEFTYDANQLRSYFVTELMRYENANILYNCYPVEVNIRQGKYNVRLSNGIICKTGFVINASYGSTNLLNALFHCDIFEIKYELCEVILCNLCHFKKEMTNYGFTVMDGPFFSIMPFGNTGMHSLTSVTFTPHRTSHDIIPRFECQGNNGALCKEGFLANCNICPAHPKSAWEYMHGLALKFLGDDYQIHYIDSLFSIKPILSKSEIDDSRPTVIRLLHKDPMFISVLSGKVSTIYDLEEALSNVKEI